MVHLPEVITPPAVPAVTLADAKAHLRVIRTDEDALITAYIAVATEFCERYTNQQLITATLKYTVDGFPLDRSAIEIPRPPLQSVEKIEYTDDDGDEQELDTDDYTVITSSVRGRVIPSHGKSWPRANRQASVRITYKAGFGDTPATVPTMMRHSILLMVYNLFDQRAPVITGSISKELEHSLTSLLSMNRRVDL
jgi:uncharacterized phiE125 gp8 family phage protein